MKYTKKLLSALSHVHGPLGVELGAGLLALALLPAPLLADLLWAAWRWARLRSIYAQTTVWCPRGHAVEVRGPDITWECQSCHYVVAGVSAFQPCVRCSHVPAYIACPCGSSVSSEAFDLLEDP